MRVELLASASFFDSVFDLCIVLPRVPRGRAACYGGGVPLGAEVDVEGKRRRIETGKDRARGHSTFSFSKASLTGLVARGTMESLDSAIAMTGMGISFALNKNLFSEPIIV